MKKKHQNKVYIFALCDVFYDAFYIKGLKEYFGVESLIYSLDRFPDFKQGTFAVLIEDECSTKKIIIDSKDTSLVSLPELEWCDVYGKINYNLAAIPTDQNEKIIPIGPSFGIKIWSFFETFKHVFKNYMLVKNVVKNKREFFANYWRQYKRIPLSKYENTDQVKNNYVFFISTIWRNEEKTNLFRSYFIETCLSNKKIEFEGGFAPRKDGNNLTFESLLTQKRYPFKKYISKIKKSSIVFNTPAVLSCHGWKLAEFLAMGKAIISTNHINILPFPLVENEHIVYLEENFSDFQYKVDNLIKDEKLREKIAFNSKKYFEDYLSPINVIQNLYRNI